MLNVAVQSAFMFKGSCRSIDEIDLDDAKCGDVWLCTSDDSTYLFDGNKFQELGASSDSEEKYAEDSQLVDCRCTSCGAPLEIKSKYGTKCEYCGSVFQFVG